MKPAHTNTREPLPPPFHSVTEAQDSRKIQTIWQKHTHAPYMCTQTQTHTHTTQPELSSLCSHFTDYRSGSEWSINTLPQLHTHTEHLILLFKQLPQPCVNITTDQNLQPGNLASQETVASSLHGLAQVQKEPQDSKHQSVSVSGPGSIWMSGSVSLQDQQSGLRNHSLQFKHWFNM